MSTSLRTTSSGDSAPKNVEVRMYSSSNPIVRVAADSVHIDNDNNLVLTVLDRENSSEVAVFIASSGSWISVESKGHNNA